MKEVGKTIRIHALVEIIFDTVYLIFVFAAGVIMLIQAQSENTTLLLFGVLCITLGFGDAFHLLPRIYGQLTGHMDSCRKALGIGKLVTSITMTIFYILLYCIWAVFYQITFVNPVFITLVILAVIRILICILPQNRWLSSDMPLNFAVYRNIPFFVMGLLLIFQFLSTAWARQDLFRFMPLAIGLSFLFYIPVVLFSKNYPKLGVLMLPKTLAYVWIICMGLQLLN